MRRRILTVLTLALAAAASAVDLSNCQMCHKLGGLAPTAPTGLGSSAHDGVACLACHTTAREPHKDGVRTLSCGACHRDELTRFNDSIHKTSAAGGPTCATCHGSGHRVADLASPKLQPHYAPAACADCHPRENDKYLATAHGIAAKAGNLKAPGCTYCHFRSHDVKAVTASPELAAANELEFCGECHTGRKAAVGPPYVMPDPRAQLLAGSHGGVNAATGLINANCTDCHGPHDEQPAWAPSSAVNYRNLSNTCGRCHPQERLAYDVSIHGTGAAAGITESPTCASCHGNHYVVSFLGGPAPESAADRWQLTVALCSGCHVSPALAAKFNMRTDPAETFSKTYHGVVHAGGKAGAADCGRCHGVHDVLPSADPRSRVNAAHLETTCGGCHADKGERFYRSAVHVPLKGFKSDPARVVGMIYGALIAVILGGMAIHNGLDVFAKLKETRKEQLVESPAIVRLNWLERAQHLLLLTAFATLAYTGFTIKWPSAWFARWLVGLEGDLNLRSGIHKTTAVILIGTAISHVGYMVFSRRGRGRLKALWPRPRDVADAARAMLHNLGVVKYPPGLGEFNYAEKAEYWALVWGTALMVLTGAYIWLDPVFHRFFPFWLYTVIRTVHLFEAILATASIVIWHFYAVIFDPAVRPMNFAWVDGKMTLAQIRREKKKYYEELERQRQEKESPPPGEAEL